MYPFRKVSFILSAAQLSPGDLNPQVIILFKKFKISSMTSQNAS